MGNRRFAMWVMVLSLFALCAASCSSGGGSAGEKKDVGLADQEAADGGDDVRILPSDVPDQPDVLEDLVPADLTVDTLLACEETPGMRGCPCAENEDCDSGWCVFHLGDKVCSGDCIGECPEGMSCQEVGVGPDQIFICKSLFPSLCLPCDHSADCPSPGDRCLVDELGAGAFCGSPCETDDDCYHGGKDYLCLSMTTTEGDVAGQCVPAAGTCECSGYAVAEALGTPCFVANEWGSCPGWRTCTEAGLTACSAPAPVEEVCGNDADEDCDGIVDDADVCVICSCEGKECGDDGCGNACGQCPVNHVCQLEGTCVCVPNCAGKECGDDGCGDSCGECDPGTLCSFGACQAGCEDDAGCPALHECVDGFCQPDVPDMVHLYPPVEVVTIPGQETPELTVRVHEADLTEADGAAPGLAVQIGFGPPEYDPTTNPQKWLWTDAAFGDDLDGTDEYWVATLASDTPGKYRFTFRLTLDGSHWVYADGDGSADGFQADKTGQWTVLAPPDITKITPDHGTVLGGQTVTIAGNHFVEGLTLTVDGEAVAPASVEPTGITFVTPPHAAGDIIIAVENPSGQTVVVADGYTFVRRFAPTVDGDLAEWDSLLRVAENTVESNWDPALNHLDALYAAFDDQYLYLGMAGVSEWNNYVVGYVDIDFGAASGTADMLALSDNDGDGDLDDALSNTLHVTAGGFGADFGWGTRGLASFQMGDALGNATYVGWRKLGLPYDLAWLQGSVICQQASCEAAIPLATLFAGDVPQSLTPMALFAKLIDRYGDLGGVSNQTLPEFTNADDLTEVGAVAVLDLWL